MRTVLLDTNVLLADPGALFAFPDTEIVIPETVLGELDKLKTSRVDPDLRFRGREVSRALFDLSESGSLIEGVALPDGGTLRVVPFESEADLPEGMSARNPDDRILAVALSIRQGGRDDMALVTNDLNMLLKAQTLGLPVQRYGEGVEGNFARRYIIRPFQRYKIPLGILAVALAIFAAIIFVTVWGPQAQPPSQIAMPAELREVLSPTQEQAVDNYFALQQRPTDKDALAGLANAYYDLFEQTSRVRFAQLAIKYYQRYLELNPGDVDARADLASSFFYAGQTDRAIQEALFVIERAPDHVQANYNLGIFYWRGRNDRASASAQFRKVVELTRDGDAHALAARQEASKNLAEIEGSGEATATPTATPTP